MTLEQKIGQLMVIGFDGTTLNADLRRMIADYHIGGVILFARNVQSPEQVARLTNELQRIALESGHPGLFIAIDQEGGRVARLTEAAGFTEFPSAMAITATGSPGNARRMAAAMAVEMQAVGINVDFAPDLDVNNNPLNPVIGIRSFSSDPAKVAEFGLAFAQGLQENGVMAFGKHFPGHGDTAVDSHVDLPLVPHERARLEQIELFPFRAAIEADIAGIMSAHVTFPAIDPTPGLAATLSRPVLTGLLREELGYDGLIITDSLEMGALAANGYPPEVAATQAFAAGADLLLFNRDHAMHRKAFENLLQSVQEGKVSQEQLDASVERVLRAKQRFGLMNPQLVEIDALADSLKIEEHLSLSRELAAKSVTLLRDPQGWIPLKKDQPILVVEAGALSGMTEGLGETTLQVDAQPTASQIADILRMARPRYTVIVAVHDLQANTAQVQLVQELMDENLPVLVLASRNPFDAAVLPDNATILITYGWNPPVREVLAEVLVGNIEPSGQLPIKLP
jgi:beta-N-acetylhexosaminidase